MKCPKCQSSNSTKFGRIKEIQRYRCKDCDYNYTDRPDAPNKNHKKCRIALIMYLEGLSYRKIAKLLNVSHTSIRNWITKYGESLHLVRNAKPIRLKQITSINTEIKKTKKIFREGYIFLEQTERTHISILSPIVKIKKTLPLEDEYYWG